jgi:hypothetical protein
LTSPWGGVLVEELLGRLDRGGLDVAGGLDVPLEGQDADPAVLGERAERRRRVGGGDGRVDQPGVVGDVVARLRQGRDRGDEIGDPGLVRRLVERVPLRRGHDHVDGGVVEGVTGLGEQLLLEVRGLLRRDAGDGELVRHRLGERRSHAPEHDGEDEPAGEEEGPPPEGGRAEAVEHAGHGGLLVLVGGRRVAA